MNPWLLAGGAGALFLFAKSRGGASALIDSIGAWNPGGGTPGVPGTVPPGSGGSSSIARLAGDELSSLTGNAKFAQIGSKIDSVFSKFSSAGSHKDDLVNVYQNPLHTYLAEVVGAWNAELSAGRANAQIREKVKGMLRAAAAEFYAICNYYPDKGPGGTATIKHVVEDILIADMDRLHLS